MVRASLGLESWMEFFYVEIFFLSFFSMFCLKNAGESCPAAVSTDPTNEQQHVSAEADTQVEEALNSTVPFYCMLTVKACILFYVFFFLTTSMFSLSPAADSSRHTASSKDHWSTYWCWCHQVTAMWKETGTSTISFPKKGSSDSLIWTKYTPLVLPLVWIITSGFLC